MPLSDKRRDRFRWIADQVRLLQFVDVLNSDFVDDYIERWNAGFYPVHWGAHKCPQLGRDLSEMKRRGYLKRGRIGLAGNWQPGFPTWVWSYSLGSMAEYLPPLD